MKDRLMKFIKKNLKWILLFIFIVTFAEVTIRVYGNDIMRRDIIGYKLISKLISDKVTPIAIFITQFGSAIVLIILSVLLLVIIKNKKIGTSIILNLFLVGVLNQLLKHIVQRPRPTEFRIIDERGYSFPSGHSMASVAFYGFLIYLIYKKVENKKLKIFSIIILTILIALIGSSRIYLGVHYTSDVLAGLFISISYLLIYTSIIDDYIGTNKIDKEEIK